MTVKITGLDKILAELNELQKAMTTLDGTITKVEINPENPQSIQNAIAEMEAAIDSKAFPYRHNSMVAKIVHAAKEHYREQVLNLAHQKAS